MRLSIISLLSAVLAVTNAFAIEPRAPKNMIKNGGFEGKVATPWRFHDDTFHPELVIELVRPGIAGSRTSFRVTMKQINDTTLEKDVFKFDQDLALVKGQKYDISCDFQFDNPNQPAELRLVYRDFNDKTHTIAAIPQITVTSPFSLTGWKAPTDSKQLELTFINYQVDPKETQIIWVDNVRVAKAAK